MGYVDFAYFQSLYGDSLPEQDFNRLAWEACRKLDIATTGAGNVKKLRVAFPTAEEDAELVKRCACELIQIEAALRQAQKRVEEIQGYITREDGTVVNKQVAAVSAGNESITYVASGSSGGATLIDRVLADTEAQEQLFRDTIVHYLSGVADANGVNLLYMGGYPVPLKQ